MNKRPAFNPVDPFHPVILSIVQSTPSNQTMTAPRFNASLLSLFAVSILSSLIAISITRAAESTTEEKTALAWHAVEPENIEGQGWTDVKAPFDRLPARAEKLVRPEVWTLSRDSSGLYVTFKTNAPQIAVKWQLNTEEISFAHMAATGVSGVDLYFKDDNGWHFHGVGRPVQYPDNEATFTAHDASSERDVWYRLYLPLYNGVKSVEIGVPADCTFGFEVPKEIKPPIVVYGTSITQGGCAARPGMAYPSILGRRLDREFINLGFSGNGKTEPEVATLLAELEPAAFVIDSLPNLKPDMLAERMPKFIEILRARHPHTPILLVQNPLYPSVPYEGVMRSKVEPSNEILAKIHADRVAAGDTAITLVPACDLAASGGEGTVDGVHPTDLGFVMLADVLEPYLKKILAEPPTKD